MSPAPGSALLAPPDEPRPPADRAELAPSQLVRPWWRRTRAGWLLGAALVVAAVLLGVVVSALGGSPAIGFDPNSAAHDGSKALARLLAEYGAPVHRSTSVADTLQHSRDAAVLVTDPDDYSDGQLRRLAAGSARLVLVEPGTRASAALGLGVQPIDDDPDDDPQCGDPGAQAAGTVSLPDDAQAYLGGPELTSCYGGGLLTAPRTAIFGMRTLLRNDHLAHEGVAALDVNAITDSRRLPAVVWLLPGADAQGSGAASVDDLFPDWSVRAFEWLLLVLLLAAIWRARRLGGLVTEPLPVVVRSVEVVEGHGRLYARAGDRERAGHALRVAATRRLASRLSMPRGSSPQQVAAAATLLVGRSPAEIFTVLAGPPPADDAALLRLALDLDALEAAAGGPIEGNRA